ncbi:MAG: hypothetical protein SPH08_04305, partial [Sodaliphilus sp.]|nr:hypothetical protein [Sodaliphilus sp.]
KREAEAIQAAVRARGPFKSRTEILKDTLTAIPGITSIRETDVMGDHKYYKKFRITFNGGWFDVFNGGMDFRVTDSAGGFGNSQEFRTDTDDANASVNNTRNKVVAYIKRRMETIKRGGMSARERAALEMRNRRQRRDLTSEYNEFVKMAEETRFALCSLRSTPTQREIPTRKNPCMRSKLCLFRWLTRWQARKDPKKWLSLPPTSSSMANGLF